MKKWISLAACAVVPAVFAADTDTDVRENLKLLQMQVQEQRSMINALQNRLDNRAEVSNLVKEEVDAALARGFAQEQAGPTISLGKAIDGLKLKGDMRLRYEYRNDEGDSDAGKDDDRGKSRFRHRVRLGGVWTNSAEDWEVALGLEAGSSDGTSANDSWNKSSVFESGDLFLDYAYAKHTMGCNGKLILGQQKNPFTSTYILWDGDLRPTGATYAYAGGPVFATAGAYNVRSDAKVTGSGDQSSANMFAGQIGTGFSSETGLSAKVAAGYYHYDAETSEYTFGEGEDDYQFQIADLYGEVKGKVGDVSLKSYGQFCLNLGVDDNQQQTGGTIAGYDPEDNDTAWVLGLEAKFGKFKAGYSYAQIGGESVPGFTTDSDFGDGLPDGGLNSSGHKLSLGYGITKNCSVGATAIFTEVLEDDANTDDLAVSLYQFDLKYKF